MSRPSARRCLLVSYLFPPAGGAGAVRMAKLCKYLGRLGWAIDVLAAPGDVGWSVDEELASEGGTCRVERLALPLRLPTHAASLRRLAKDPQRTGPPWQMARAALGLGRELRNRLALIDAAAIWSLVATRAARRAISRGGYDVMLTSSPPHAVHLVGLAASWSKRVPWVAELRDPWVGNPWRGVAGPVRRRIDAGLEGTVLRRADAVVTVSPTMERMLRARHGAALGAKLQVITNGFDPEDLADSPPDRSSGPFTLAYVGSFDATLTPPDAILAAMRRLGRERPELARQLRLRLVGTSDLRASQALRAYMQEDPGAKIVVDGSLPHRAAMGAMAEADALLLVLAPGTDWVMTSKVFEYLGSGRPILALVPPGDCRDLLNRCGNAVVVAPEATDEQVSVLARAVTERRLLAPSTNPSVLATCAWPALAERYDRLLSEAAPA